MMILMILISREKCALYIWFKHILFMTEHDKGLGRAKKLCLALSSTVQSLADLCMICHMH